MLNIKQKSPASRMTCRTYRSGEGGIRTPGTSQYAGFQDRCNRPLCHLSKKKDATLSDSSFPFVRPQGFEPWTH